MKAKFLLFALFVFGLGACTQRTCPTYTKADTNTEVVVEVKSEKV
jgi:hypothetical protein